MIKLSNIYKLHYKVCVASITSNYIPQFYISQWFNSGAYCIGMGSKLISKEYIAENNFDALEAHILKVTEIINNVCEVNQ